MLKRIVLFAFVLSTLVLVALAPMNMTTTPQNAIRLQTTVVATVAAIPTMMNGSNPAAMPTMMNGVVPSPVAPIIVTNGGMTSSTMIIIGLLVVLGFAVLIGGMALMSRRGSSE